MSICQSFCLFRGSLYRALARSPVHGLDLEPSQYRPPPPCSDLSTKKPVLWQGRRLAFLPLYLYLLNFISGWFTRHQLRTILRLADRVVSGRWNDKRTHPSPFLLLFGFSNTHLEAASSKYLSEVFGMVATVHY